MFAKLVTVVPATFASLGGVGLYFLGDRVDVWLAVVVAAVVWVIGYALLSSGREVLASKPILGVVLMTGWIIGVIAIGAGITAILIVVGVEVADAVSKLSKNQADAVGSALMGVATLIATTVLTDDLEKGTGGIWPSAKTQAAMATTFKDKFAANSRPFEAVYEDRVSGGEAIEFWGFRARLSRAKIIDQAL